jgi:anaerobic selenocysteine-containing dehydrogenase
MWDWKKPSLPCQKDASGISRRKFLYYSAFLGGSAALASQLDWALELLRRADGGDLSPGEAYELARAENIIYSVCLQCHTSCPIKAKVLDGVLVKIDGPAYSSQAMLPHVDYATSPFDAATIDGKVCPKGQAGVQTLYDPYRIVKVLKRNGPRGSNRWVTIPFAQAIQEIVEGGYLFKHVPGEEKRKVPGLKDLFAVRDAALMKALAEDAKAVAKKQMTLEQFKEKHGEHLGLLIDPDHPDLGPINNRFVFLAGRIQHGRKEFSQRFVKDAFGSVNWYEHTTICEQSHHIAYQMMTNRYESGKWSGGKTHMKPDALNAEFIIYFGTGAFEANFGPPPMAEKVTQGIVDGRLKIAVVDPRFSKTAAKAWQWVPIKPGTDAALALGMIRWILENERFDRVFLANANKAAAVAAGESSWSTATWLVTLGEDSVPGKYLRASQLGLGDEHTFVVLRDGKPVPCQPYNDKNPVQGELFVDTTLAGIRVKSALQLLKEEAFSRSLSQWADLCGVPVETIETLARELTAHGKKAAVELYRGAVEHTNGYYNAQAIITLNLLVGNPDWRGGLSAGGSHWHEVGDKEGQPFPLGKLHPNALKSFGVPITREKVAYEDTTLFNGYPAKRPFYPFTNNVYQEVLPAARAGYPYSIGALFLHMGTPALSVPAAQTQIDALTDLRAIPLFFACDVVIGETSMYADYIFPDLSIWERWGTPHPTPDVQTKTSKVRQPIVAPLTEIVEVFGEACPLCMETVMLAIAEKLKLPGFGANGFGEGMDFTRMEDFYLKMVANIAYGDKPGDAVPEADEREMKLFLEARRHLPPAVFDPQRWAKAVGQEKWRRVVYVLNRGGRYESFEKAYKGKFLGHPFAGLFSLYVEPVATARHSITGRVFSGVPRFEPITDAAGRPVQASSDFDLHLITYKDILGGQSRTQGPNYWLTALWPENEILMNSRDAQRYGLKNGDRARLVSPSNSAGLWNLRNGQRVEVVGKVKVIEGIRPGTIAVSWHFGHWAYGASDAVVDGKVIKGDKRRGTGLCPNVLMLTDPYLRDVCLTDPIGGSSSFYDTPVKLVKVSTPAAKAGQLGERQQDLLAS